MVDLVLSLDLAAISGHYHFEELKDEQGKVIGRRARTNRGQPAYDPWMMTALLLHACVTGTPSSRQIEKRCQEDVAYRVLSSSQKPDHDTIAEFRKVHLKALTDRFLQVFELYRSSWAAPLPS